MYSSLPDRRGASSSKSGRYGSIVKGRKPIGWLFTTWQSPHAKMALRAVVGVLVVFITQAVFTATKFARTLVRPRGAKSPTQGGNARRRRGLFAGRRFHPVIPTLRAGRGGARLHERPDELPLAELGFAHDVGRDNERQLRDVRRDELHRGRGAPAAPDHAREIHVGVDIGGTTSTPCRPSATASCTCCTQFGEGRLRQRHRHGADARGPAGVGALRPPLGAVDRRPRARRPGGQGRRGARRLAARRTRMAAGRTSTCSSA